MSTPTTKAKPTAGPTGVYSSSDGVHVKQDGSLLNICDIHKRNDLRERMANAHLISDAFNVHHETGLTPRELVERIKQMKEAFALLGEKLVNMPETLEKQDCYSIINKATE